MVRPKALSSADEGGSRERALYGSGISTVATMSAAGYAWQLHGWMAGLAVLILLIAALAISQLLITKPWTADRDGRKREGSELPRGPLRWSRWGLILSTFIALAISGAEVCDATGCRAFAPDISWGVVLLVAWAIGGASSVWLTVLAGVRARDDLGFALLVCLVLFAVGPLVLLCLVGLNLLLPLVRPLLPNSTASEETPSASISREKVLCRMIAIRQQRDPELKRHSRPEHWPMYQLATAPEAVLLSAIEMFLWQRDGTNDVATPAYQSIAPPEASRSLDEYTHRELADYAASAMKLGHGGYLRHGDDLLDEVVKFASAWVIEEIAQAQTSPAYPPTGWWQGSVSWELAKQGCLPAPFEAMDARSMEDDTTRTAQQWRNLRTKAVDSDDLYAFDSPPSYWEELGGRAGLVLVRRGSPIEHVTLVMS